MADPADPQSEDHGFWSPSVGVKLTFVGVLIAAVTLYFTVVQPKPDASPGPSTTTTTTTTTTAEDPADVEATWRREQGALCDRFNTAGAQLPTVQPGDGVNTAVNARSGARAVRKLAQASSALDAPEDYAADVQRMVSLWSQGALAFEAMARAAESGDATSYAQHEERLEQKMAAGMRIAYGHGATQCI